MVKALINNWTEFVVVLNWDTEMLAGSNAKYRVLVWWHDFSVDDRKHFDTNDKNETPRDPQ